MLTAITFVSCGFITLNAADFCYVCGRYYIGGRYRSSEICDQIYWLKKYTNIILIFG